jgi:putative ABC transport system permease protein
MLVNEAFVRHFFPTHTPLGTALSVTARLDPLGDRPLGSKTIVGVVADAVGRSIREPALPTVYVPLAQHPDTMADLVVFLGVRSSGAPPLSLSRGLATALHSVDPNLILTFTPIDEQISQALAQDRLVATLAGAFGLLALVLAGLGLYGLTAYAVTRRRTELGIRLALGARPAGIVRLVLSRVWVLMGLGALVGAAGSLVASRLIASLLYGVDAHDPLTLVGAVFTLLAVGTFAGWLPAWRASRIDPADVIREG